MDEFYGDKLRLVKESELERIVTGSFSSKHIQLELRFHQNVWIFTLESALPLSCDLLKLLPSTVHCATMRHHSRHLSVRWIYSIEFCLQCSINWLICLLTMMPIYWNVDCMPHKWSVHGGHENVAAKLVLDLLLNQPFSQYFDLNFFKLKQ